LIKEPFQRKVELLMMMKRLRLHLSKMISLKQVIAAVMMEASLILFLAQLWRLIKIEWQIVIKQPRIVIRIAKRMLTLLVL